jgi:hypothetical protein
VAVTDWLRHEFEVSGRRAEVAAFRAAAAGANIVPWELDLEAAQETWFQWIVRAAPPNLSVAVARALTVQLRAAVDSRHGKLCAWIGRNRACLLDLHALVPIPPTILRRGPDDRVSLAWLWEHWGTTEVLRQVREIPARPGRRRGLTRFRLEFYSADWTPWRALVTIRARWPSLRFDIWPDYDGGTASPSDRPDG